MEITKLTISAVVNPQANAIGRSAKPVREFLEKNYTDEVSASEDECIKLALKALLEVVQSGAKNVELAIMKDKQPLKVSSIVPGLDL